MKLPIEQIMDIARAGVIGDTYTWWVPLDELLHVLNANAEECSRCKGSGKAPNASGLWYTCPDCEEE